MNAKTFIVYGGEQIEFTGAEIQEQLNEFDMYYCADNAIGWMVRKIIMTTRLRRPASIKARIEKMLAAMDVIDVRLD